MSGILPVILFNLVVFTLVLAVLAAATSLGLAQLEAAHPPTGQFVTVQGVRLHVAVLGLPPGSPGAAPRRRADPRRERKFGRYAVCTRREARLVASRNLD